MDRQQAVEYINSNPQLHLERAKKDVQGKPSYICPLCGNGKGSSGDGLTSRDGVHWHCFKCGFNGDMIQLIAQEQGIADGGSKEAFEAARAVYGLDTDNTPYTHNTKKTQPAQAKEERGKVSNKEFIAFINEHCKAGCEASYLQARGLSRDTIDNLHFGYDKEQQAVVIPYTKSGSYYYVERYTEPKYDNTGKEIRYHIPKGAAAGVFNEAALEQGKPVFICEGAIDAASIVEVGGQAVAINSTANAGGFVRYLKDRGSKCRQFIICMDTDEAGTGARDTLLSGLQELEYEAVAFAVPAGYKDANEALQGNRQGLERAVESAVKDFDKATLEEIQSHKVSNLLPAFWDYVNDSKNNKPIKTGFDSFDTAIGGGLLPKFYIIGAVTSLGKTAFVGQIADNAAQGGNDVLMFSLEMSKEDIIARSISRTTYILDTAKNGNSRLAKTELGIVMGSRHNAYSKAELELIGEAYKEYVGYAGEHISIYEGKRTADSIRAAVEQYISFTGKIPLVIVDYLQILQPPQQLIRATQKEQIDYNIDVFSAMRRELKTPVIGISSLNRANYNTVADTSSFKGSGDIEYSGDAIITLELDVERDDKGTESKVKNKARETAIEAMRADVREIKLTFQKNRGNRVGTKLYYRYYAKFNFFEEDWTKDNVL